MNAVQNVAKTIIIDECKELIHVINIIPKNSAAMLSLGLIPYIALVVNESLKWCENCKVVIPKLSDEQNYIIKRLRVKCKFYTGDNKYSLIEQRKRLEEVVMIEKHYFENQSWLAKQLYKYGIIKDAGTYLWDGIYIGNTILYSDYFEPFRNIQKNIYESSHEIYNFSVTIGKTLQSIIAILDGNLYECKNEHIHLKEPKSKDYFLNNCFFYSGDIDKMMLFNILCSINFIINYLSNLLTNASTLLFRIKYLTLYHVTEDLKQLDFTEIADNVLFKRDFRNVMAHYGLFKVLSKNKIIDSAKMFGLIESNFDMSFQDMVDLMDDNLRIIQYNLEKFFELDNLEN
ncbi:hypothetical protein [Clostridium estertheticum]|uniref:hypothetical protein n=1 Tax=Clostridium estertheticum TaxID=238834 RepID=UPI001C0D5949|nr:hypothetical protein [Clostridium estertheticum]MBU3171141.1 hypothetical protein [Clostridium estertheticum]